MPVAATINMIIKCKCPPLNTVKSNLAASYDIHNSLVGVGMVLRDYLGKSITKKTIFLGRVTSPLLAEILGV